MLRPNHTRYELTEMLVYKDVEVPKGYLTDGISYKFRLLGIFVNKFDPLYIEAAIVHDYLTDLGEWEKANRYFAELLPAGWRSEAMIAGVNAYARYKGYINVD